MAAALETVVLSRSDAQYLQQYVAPDSLRQYTPKVILCALRGDLHDLPLPPDVHLLPHPSSVQSQRQASASAKQQACQSAEPQAQAVDGDGSTQECMTTGNTQPSISSRPYLT